MIAKIHSAACLGLHAYPVEIEVDVANGLPQLTIVGLPDTSVKEARERVRSAIKNSGFRFPPEKITVNLAPADIRKEGPAFDLPIALAILAASEAIPAKNLRDYTFLGELALDGTLRPCRGAIVISDTLGGSFVFPKNNAGQAALAPHARVFAAGSLAETVEFLQGKRELPLIPSGPGAPFPSPDQPVQDEPDFADVQGQHHARRAAEIAAAGGHNLLFIGSPGSGKTMIARRMGSLLPPLEFAEALEITKIQSVAGTASGFSLVTRHPFRSPHHSVSAAAMAGGGSLPRPGEISLAHGGILFLDEFPEFRRDVIETLRAPLEEGRITISRTKNQVTFPCRLMLVAAMNPCPCGFLTDPRRNCRCSLGQIQRYQARISGPILDRVDLHVDVPTLPYQTLVSQEKGEASARIRERVLKCRGIQADRYPDRTFKLNALMRPHEIRKFAVTDKEGKRLLEAAMKELRLSARAYYKILKIARTAADLEGAEKISASHIAEAVQYRTLDRQWS